MIILQTYMATICPGTYIFKRGEVCSKKKITETKYSSAEILTWFEPDERKTTMSSIFNVEINCS